MKTTQVAAAIIGAAAIAVCGAVFAQQTAPGFYVGGDLGKADFGGDKNDFWRLTAGYRFGGRFAVELSRSDFGDLPGGVEATAWELAGLGLLPIADRLSAYGLLGLARIKPGTADHVNELTFGVGAQYELTRRFDVRAQWQRYNTDEDIDVMSIGVLWKF